MYDDCDIVTCGLRVLREQLFHWVSTHDLELLESTLGMLRVALVCQGKANSIYSRSKNCPNVWLF
jgi:hypothetical protein